MRKFLKRWRTLQRKQVKFIFILTELTEAMTISISSHLVTELYSWLHLRLIIFLSKIMTVCVCANKKKIVSFSDIENSVYENRVQLIL